MKRVLNISLYDVQIIAGIALFDNRLIEMQTGEGKTFTAVFPAYLRALTEKGVHILTFNDYLAKRDANWMRPVYEFLGLSVGYIQEGMSLNQRKKSYNCHITYATAKEVGFDFLKSFSKYDKNELVLRPFNYAIIDEADAVLIDEAKNPLVLSGNIIKSDIDFVKILKEVSKLNNKTDFDIENDTKNIFLTETGIDKLERNLQIKNLMSENSHELHSFVNLALHAKYLLKKDIDYVVRDGKVKLVDEFTGRIMKDRKWRNGLQTAVEVKEDLEVQSEGTVLNSITLQHFIQQYPCIAGMTATARDSAQEFKDFYNLDIISIPPNKKSKRIDLPDKTYKTKNDKYEALIREVKEINKTGQPLLIGTLNIKESEELSEEFSKCGIKHNVLNAKNDEAEAKIIANSGKLYAVTISTNMAGRGTDILLGGTDTTEKKDVIKLGGLYIIGTNRHESIRIDHQLRGRSGRQGDIGTTCFFVSLKDDLMAKYGLMDSLPKQYKKLSSEKILHNRYLQKYFNHIQKIIEGQAFDIRQTLFTYADFIEKQRDIIQEKRQQILFNEENLTIELIRKYKIEINNPIYARIKELILFQYDSHWAKHLEYLFDIKDSIHLLRIGGLDPLAEFQKCADKSFKELYEKVFKTIDEKVKVLLKNKNIDLKELGVNKPSSTWTYMINDNPFGNKLSLALLNNSNIGFQIDPFAAFTLLIYGIIEKFKIYKQKSG